MGKVLVTGGAGYIGSHTVVELLHDGYEVIVVDNFSNSSPKAIERIEEITGKSVELVELDLTDAQAVEKLFQDNSIESVVHFAALKSVGESVTKPLEYYENNLISTLVLCQAMLKHGVNKLIFSSSCTVYGPPEEVPAHEEMAIRATNPYGQTKLMSEQILKDLCVANSNFYVTCLRYFNPVGAHESGLIGEDPNGIPNNLLPFATQVAIGKLPKLKVYGADYDTEDGTGVRDYIHVVDLARGHLAALKHIDEFKNWEAYNLGTGKGNSVLEVINALEKASGKTITYEVVERRPGDIAATYADPSKANKNLGWKTTKDLDQACVDAWNWQTKNPNGYSANE